MFGVDRESRKSRFSEISERASAQCVFNEGLVAIECTGYLSPFEVFLPFFALRIIVRGVAVLTEMPYSRAALCSSSLLSTIRGRLAMIN